MAKRSETGQYIDVLTTTAEPAVTLNQVKEALAKVAAHPQCSKKKANDIAGTYGRATKNDWRQYNPRNLAAS